MSTRKNHTQEIDDALTGLRDLITRKDKNPTKVPLSRICNHDIRPFNMKVGEWEESPWLGLRWMLTHINDVTGSKYILCEAMVPVDMGARHNTSYVEEVIMMEGCMEDRVSGQRIYPGIRYKIPLGEPHWPVFPGPALFMVIFRDGPI